MNPDELPDFDLDAMMALCDSKPDPREWCALWFHVMRWCAAELSNTTRPDDERKFFGKELPKARNAWMQARKELQATPHLDAPAGNSEGGRLAP